MHDTVLTVLYVQPVAEAGGSDQTLLRMVEQVGGRVDAHVVLPGPSPLAERFAAAGATLHTVPMRRITTTEGLGWWIRYALGWPLAVARLTRLARRIGVDVVHSNSLHTWYGWAAALLTRRPHVWHAREIVVQSRAALRLERFLTRHFAAVVLCMSDAVAAPLEGARRRTLYDDVDRERFRPHRAGTFRQSVGLADDLPLAGVVTRVDTWKGVDIAIEAFAAAGLGGRAQLVVVGADVTGKESYADTLRRRSTDVGDITWAGARSDVPDVMADLDVLVAVSTEPEPYGMNVVEALASGTPVIVCAHGGHPEIVSRAAAGAGWVVPPRDVDATATVLRTALAVTTSSVIRGARPALLPEPEAFDYTRLYEELVRAGSGR